MLFFLIFKKHYMLDYIQRSIHLLVRSHKNCKIEITKVSFLCLHIELLKKIYLFYICYRLIFLIVIPCKPISLLARLSSIIYSLCLINFAI